MFFPLPLFFFFFACYWAGAFVHVTNDCFIHSCTLVCSITGPETLTIVSKSKFLTLPILNRWTLLPYKEILSLESRAVKFKSQHSLAFYELQPLKIVLCLISVVPFFHKRRQKKTVQVKRDPPYAGQEPVFIFNERWLLMCSFDFSNFHYSQ